MEEPVLVIPGYSEKSKHYFETGEILNPPTVSERVAAAKQHLKHSLEWKGLKLGVLEMRRHYTNYFRGFPHIKPIRSKLVTTAEPEILFELMDQIEEKYSGFIEERMAVSS